MPEPRIILPHGGYRKLIVYRKSDTIYHPDWDFWQPIFESRPAETICNLQMTIIRQTQSLLNGMLERQESEFRQFGGIRERMHAARSAVRGQDWDKSIYSRLEGAGTVEELEARAAEVRRRLASAVASIKRRKGWDQ